MGVDVAGMVSKIERHVRRMERFGHVDHIAAARVAVEIYREFCPRDAYPKKADARIGEIAKKAGYAVVAEINNYDRPA